MKGCKPFIFHHIDRLFRSDRTIFRSKAQKNHFRNFVMQDGFLERVKSIVF